MCFHKLRHGVQFVQEHEQAWQKADAAIISVVRQIISIFFLGGFLQQLVDVGRVTKRGVDCLLASASDANVGEFLCSGSHVDHGRAQDHEALCTFTVTMPYMNNYFITFPNFIPSPWRSHHPFS
jgi:hypothetical protein